MDPTAVTTGASVSIPKLKREAIQAWESSRAIRARRAEALQQQRELGTENDELIQKLIAYRHLIEHSVPVEEDDVATESILIRPHRYHEEQARLWHDLLYKPDIRFLVVPAGRRSGKTEVFKRWLLWCLLDPANLAKAEPAEYFAAAPVMPQAKRLYWEWFKKRLAGFIQDKSEVEKTILTTANARITVFGMDSPERIEGSPWDGGVLDEYGNMKERAWTFHIRPALYSEGRPAARCGLIGVPEGMNHYYDRWQDALDNKTGEWDGYTWYSSEVLPPSEIEAAKRDLDPRTFRQEYEGSFEEQTGRVYYGFERAEDVHHFEVPAELGLSAAFPVEVGVDFNVHPMSAVWGFTLDHENDAHLFIRRSIEIQTASTDDLATKLWIDICEVLGIDDDDQEVHVVVYPDPSGKARKTSAQAGVTDHSILRDAGFVVKSRSKAPPVRDRLNAVNSRFCNGVGDRRIHIHPECDRLVRCLSGQLYVSTGEPDKTSGLDHLPDALGYMVELKWPVQRGRIKGVQR
jgi:hypothetical protein